MSVLLKIDSKSKGHKHSVNSVVKMNENSFVTASDDRTIKCFSIF